MQNEYEFSEYRRERRAANYRNTKQNDFLIRVILVQFIITFLFSVCLFCLYKTHSNAFIQIKEVYTNNAKKDYFPNGFQEVFANAINALSKKPKESVGGEDIQTPKKNASYSPISISEKIVNPVENARLTSHFGYRENPITKKNSFHTGVDLAVPKGTPILAAYRGKVKKATYSKARGNYIILEHQGDLKTVYCHCDSLKVGEGAYVNAGDIIAYVGSTGQSTGPHLHFELLLHDIWYNPLWVLTAS